MIKLRPGRVRRRRQREQNAEASGGKEHGSIWGQKGVVVAGREMLEDAAGDVHWAHPGAQVQQPVLGSLERVAPSTVACTGTRAGTWRQLPGTCVHLDKWEGLWGREG